MRARPIYPSIFLACVFVGCGDGSDIALDISLQPEAAAIDMAPGDAGPAADAAPLIWSECATSPWPEEYPPPAPGVVCATIDVPLSYDAAAGATVPLVVARHPAKVGATEKALFYLAGGPGGSSVQASGVIPERFSALRETFDLVFVDQRGSGLSGYLSCPDGFPSTQYAWKTCREALSDVDLDSYRTTMTATDIDFVRARLGYDQIYLFGVSYGTRTALEFIRLHEDRVKAAVLDGIVPPDVDMMTEHTRAFDLGIAGLIEDCQSDAACLAVSPSLKDDLRQRRQLLRESPHPIMYNGVEYVEDEAFYLDLLYRMLHRADLRSGIPRSIHQAINGNAAPWYALASKLVPGTIVDAACGVSPAPEGRSENGRAARFPSEILQVPDQTLGTSYIAPALYMTLLAAELYPNSGGVESISEVLGQQEWKHGDYVELAKVCETWPVTHLPSANLSPVSADTNVLLLSGDLDLNTFATWGTMAKEHLESAVHLVVPHTAHATIWNDCVAKVANDFILAGGEMRTVDVSCVDEIAKPKW